MHQKQIEKRARKKSLQTKTLAQAKKVSAFVSDFFETEKRSDQKHK
jgi:hypothetical protein